MREELRRMAVAKVTKPGAFQSSFLCETGEVGSECIWFPKRAVFTGADQISILVGGAERLLSLFLKLPIVAESCCGDRQERDRAPLMTFGGLNRITASVYSTDRLTAIVPWSISPIAIPRIRPAAGA